MIYKMCEKIKSFSINREPKPKPTALNPKPCSAEMGGDSSSSGEEDGDAEWRAAINSVTSTAPSNSSTVANGTTTTSGGSPSRADTKNIKLYQIKAQKLLDDILEKSIKVVRKEPTEVAENHSISNEGGIRLFRDAPRGILFDRVDELQGPLKRPRIAPNMEVDEKSKKFRRQLKSVVVDGDDIICSAKKARERFLAKLEARDAAAKAKAKREEERVAELKRIRGERWLPAIARQMRSK
ncbi:hypothetical protein HanXRQr2_Chr15g0682651 [Helianthus annuus]|uniref:Uncharacterized protein n=2 Tax=Helianthus annuus TaxID=4232 RepID=A0A251S741_HELAN|nr:hypothetical protein HanXRQr2_Chr15g0682651 [Helianthus annuus]KAJ0472259.1 hypothetical protein HanHA89_Chr15g0605051 [Helianthus annuus]KAJ0647857.1 hypothetical protein HanLR1_Chr15g0566381 [Helianthus annuus]KAJ0651720.1 hypothetical protein HanOQP8_Chr15g0564081 [Helianthus annuus]